MELNEYLEKSKEKRAKLINLADKYYDNNVVSDYDISDIEEYPDSFPGPTPLRFKIFESNMNKQLRKIFTPGLLEKDLEKVRILNHSTLDETIRKAYSKHLPIQKKKLLIMIPKNYYAIPLKIPREMTHKYHPSISPEKKMIAKNDTGRYKTNIKHKKNIKDALLFPVLTTYYQGNKLFYSK